MGEIDRTTALKNLDSDQHAQRDEGALRTEPVAVRIVVCVIASAVPFLLVLVAEGSLHPWPARLLVEGVAMFMFFMIAIGLHDLGAVGMQHVPPDRGVRHTNAARRASRDRRAPTR